MSENKKKTKSKRESQFAAVIKTMSHNRLAIIGLVVLAVLVLIAIFAPLLSPYDPLEVDVVNRLQKPGTEHWFGTDDMGRDMLSRMMYGARYSLLLGILTVILSTVFGMIIGAVAGYCGGAVDNVLMRLMDILSAIPAMLLALVIAAVLGKGFGKTILALAIPSIPGAARILRASFLSIRKIEYIEAARCMNCGSFRIIVKHLLPNSLAPMIVNCTMGVASAILQASGLSFIGLGVQPPTPEWGAMLAGSRDYIRDYPYLVLIPGVILMITVLSINLMGDALRDALDPKLKK